MDPWITTREIPMQDQPGSHSLRGNHQVNRNKQRVSTIQPNTVGEETPTSRTVYPLVYLKGYRYVRWVRLSACCHLESGIWFMESINRLETEPEKSFVFQSYCVPAYWDMQSKTYPWYLTLLEIF